MKIFSVIALSLFVVLVSCGTSSRTLTEILGPEGQKLFLSDQPDRGDKIDLWIRDQAPRTRSPGRLADALRR